MIIKTQIIVLLSLSITIGMMGSVYANEQYPGLDFLDFSVPDGVIDTEIERQSARLLSDARLNMMDRDDLMTHEMAEYWEDIQITAIAYGGVFNENDTIAYIGLDPSEEYRIQILTQELRNMYPNADFELGIDSFQYLNSLTDESWSPFDNFFDEPLEDTAGAQGKAGQPFRDSQSNRKAIPDNTRKLVEMGTINIQNRITVSTITFTVIIDHEDHDELNGYLKLADGTLVKLFARERGISDGVYTRTLTGSDKLSSLVGSELSGPIKLMMGDYRGGDTGHLVSWNLEVTGITYTDHIEPLDLWDNFDPIGWISDFFSDNYIDTTCHNTTDNCMPEQAGMLYTTLRESQTEPQKGTIGLGGVTTTSGEEGFLIAGHSMAPGKIGDMIYHDARSNKNENLLGHVTINNAPVIGELFTDIAFVTYVVGCDKQDSQHKTCATNGIPLTTVKPMTIFKDRNTSYNVTGVTTNLQEDQMIYWIGIRSGERTSPLVDPVPIPIINAGVETKALAFSNPLSRHGDSGGPVFVKGENNNVEFVGVISGLHPTKSLTIVVPWSEIQRDLGLNPIS